MRTKSQAGFTLIELLIVVVIIGILAAIAIPRYSTVKERAFYASLKSDLHNLGSQQEIYYADNYAYTNVAADLGFAASSDVTIVIDPPVSSGWAATATHAGLEAGEGCAVFFGSAPAPTIGTVTPSTAGAVECTN